MDFLLKNQHFGVEPPGVSLMYAVGPCEAGTPKHHSDSIYRCAISFKLQQVLLPAYLFFFTFFVHPPNVTGAPPT